MNQQIEKIFDECAAMPSGARPKVVSHVDPSARGSNQCHTWVLLVLVCGLNCCVQDHENLNRFSKAYSSFRDAEFENLTLAVGLSLPKELPDGGYKTLLAAALEVRERPASRAAYAARALDVGETYINKTLDQFGETNEQANRAVVALVEAASAPKTRPYGEGALKVAEHAREIQETYGMIRSLYLDIFARRRAVLQSILDANGTLPVYMLRMEGPKVAEMVEREGEIFAHNQRNSQRLSDAFISLRAKAGMRTYPNHLDDPSTRTSSTP